MNTLAKVVENKELNGIEIYFNEFPSKEAREALKANGFRWNHKKVCWYTKASDKAMEVAQAVANGDKVQATKKATKKAVKKANKFGVKVGDVFHTSWGYDQTNNDFFQVVELVGEQSVRVIEVVPTLEQADACAPMAEDRTYSFKACAKARYSVFIKDQEKGDLKRLRSYAKDGVSNPCFYLSSFANAYLVTSDTMKVYESWYA